MRTNILQTYVVSVALGILGCSGTDNSTPPGDVGGGTSVNPTGGNGPGTGGTSNVGASGNTSVPTGGSKATGGTTSSQVGGAATGGSPTTGGRPSTGGAATGGNGTGGAVGGSPTGGKPATGGTTGIFGTGGTATGGAPTGGKSATGGNGPTGGKSSTGGVATGGTATGGKSSTGGVATGGAATGGKSSATGGAATGGKSSTGGAATGGSSSSISCSASSPGGGTQHCSSSTQGTIGSFGWSIWSSGSGGCITPYGVGAAFKATWNNSGDFLARVGFQWDETKTYDQYGTISADFTETKSGTAGGYSMVGIYGWSNNPLIEFYIVDDWFTGRPGTNGGTTMGTIDIDGGTYDIWTHQQVNQPSIHGTTTFMQYFSVRKTQRTCGHISITEHFKKWASLGMNLGKMYEAKILIEAGGGVGSIDFPAATMTAK